MLDRESEYDLRTPNGKKSFRDAINAAAYYSDRQAASALVKVKQGEHPASPRSTSTSTSTSPVKLWHPGLRWQHACGFLNYATPLATGEGVGGAVRVVRESGLANRTDAMFTNIVCLALNGIVAAQDTYRRFSVMIVAFSVAPSGTGRADGSVADAVAAAVKIVRDSGLPHRTSAMFTELEGATWDECFDVVKRATEAVLPFGSRVSLVLKADIRPGYEGQIDSKLGRLEAAIEKQADQAHS